VKILALDLARVAGAAWRDSSGSIITRPFTLGKAGTENVSSHLLALERIVKELLSESGADTVSIELDTGRGKGTDTLRSYHIVAGMEADRNGAKVIRKLNAAAARKRAVGYGGSNLDEVYSRAKYLLGLSLEKQTDDEVDAGILLVGTEQWIVETARIEEFKRLAKAQASKSKRREPARAGIAP
jgi:Holliday junction resolvasome RuvABC endonuclease subunit